MRLLRTVTGEGDHIRRELGTRCGGVEHLEEPLEIVASVRRQAETTAIFRALLEDRDDGFVIGVDQPRDARGKRECHVRSVWECYATCVAHRRAQPRRLTTLCDTWYYRATMFARLLGLVLSVILAIPLNRRAAYA